MVRVVVAWLVVVSCGGGDGDVFVDHVAGGRFIRVAGGVW